MLSSLSRRNLLILLAVSGGAIALPKAAKLAHRLVSGDTFRMNSLSRLVHLMEMNLAKHSIANLPHREFGKSA